jgi:opacity protein-like surface antigen
MFVGKRILTVIVAAAALAAAPRPAAADWTITPFVGWNTGGSADVNGSDGTTRTSKFEHKIDYGVSIAGMGKGIFGAEFDLGYSPNFFETGNTNADGFNFTNDSNVLTLMGNLIVGAPVGGHGPSIRPYAVGGVGLIRSSVQTVGDVFDVRSKNDFGFDLGGGVMGFFGQNVGLRGDVRYFRSFNGNSDNVTTLGLSDFHFWRASAGVTFKF